MAPWQFNVDVKEKEPGHYSSPDFLSCLLAAQGLLPTSTARTETNSRKTHLQSLLVTIILVCFVCVYGDCFDIDAIVSTET